MDRLGRRQEKNGKKALKAGGGYKINYFERLLFPLCVLGKDTQIKGWWFLKVYTGGGGGIIQEWRERWK